MENVAFYREWLPLNKKEFRILAMLADFGGEYHGNLTDMCRYFSVSPQHKNGVAGGYSTPDRQALYRKFR